MTKVIYQSEVLIPEAFILTDVKMPHRNPEKIYKVEFRTKLDKVKDYAKGIEHNIQAIKKGNPWRISLQDYFCALDAGKRDNDFLNFNHKKLRENSRINFSTGIVYNPEGQKDKIIHYEGTPLEQTFEGNYVGPEGRLINLSSRDEIFRDLTGKSKNQLEKISQNVNETKIYLIRSNSKPDNPIKVQVGLLLADSVRCYFDAYWDLSNHHPAFQVLIKEQN